MCMRGGGGGGGVHVCACMYTCVCVCELLYCVLRQKVGGAVRL